MQQVNQLRLLASVVQVQTLRYTPAGIPVLNIVLAHESEQSEAGTVRKVTLQLKAVVFGADAETLSRQALDTPLQFDGFLAGTRNGKGIVFHIQAFSKP